MSGIDDVVELASERDQVRSVGSGRIRQLRGRVHRHTQRQASGLDVHDGARLQPFSLGPVLLEPEAGGRPSLPYRRICRVRRRTRRDPLRSHEDRGRRRRRGRRRDLQSILGGPCQSLRLSAQGLPALSLQRLATETVR